MTKDIRTRQDVHFIIHEFYDALLTDARINHFFEHLSDQHTLNHHLETIIDFWEDILFGTLKYGKNAMKPHFDLHKTKPFAKVHFEIWLNHLNTAIDTHFIGEKSLLMKTRAQSIATIMQIKLTN